MAMGDTKTQSVSSSSNSDKSEEAYFQLFVEMVEWGRRERDVRFAYSIWMEHLASFCFDGDVELARRSYLDSIGYPRYR